jgi:hypothetical protein
MLHRYLQEGAMTGMIRSGSQSDACLGCYHPPGVRDCTCPRCGRILDRDLFGTITAESVAGADKDAFWAGYQDSMSRWKETQSFELGEYSPVPGHETAYRAGWQHAADEVGGQEERKRGRRRGLQLLASGAVLTLAGGLLAATGWRGNGRDSYMAWPYIILGAGILYLALGLTALLTGVSDAVPPPPPSTGPDKFKEAANKQ